MRELCVLVLCFKETQTDHTILDGGGRRRQRTPILSYVYVKMQCRHHAVPSVSVINSDLDQLQIDGHGEREEIKIMELHLEPLWNMRVRTRTHLVSSSNSHVCCHFGVVESRDGVAV